ncbi:MAG: RlmE family RNA methyltransferase [Proteobacteria bacterium]|nr:RlmE family RNA methyltransferase [Pseudomonadota bacterium]MDA1023236.1 RlmE family RNA methyltransferase [Pseudomonadota bacterium]
MAKKPTVKKGSGGSGRGRTEKLKTAKRRKTSSVRWLQRQLGDPYVAGARDQGLRSRAAFKLMELDDRFHFLTPGASVVDLGAAPGGWTMVAVERVNSQGAGNGKQGKVIGMDIQEAAPISGATLIHHDFLDEAAPGMLMDLLDGPADIVLTDMAAPTTGHAGTDHLRIVGLLEAAFDFACDVLAPGGCFVGKVFKGGTEGELLKAMKQRFKSVRHAKPPASRKESAESYVVAQGFKGVKG